jgi:glutaredoxin
MLLIHRTMRNKTLRFFMKKKEIFTTNYFPFYVKEKSLLNKKKIKLFEINLTDYKSLRKKMSAIANDARTITQIPADNIHIGDSDKINKLDQEKNLDKFVKNNIIKRN